MPGDCGIAFILIQHLDPTRKSLTAELVGTSTPMRVVQAKHRMRIEPNHVYVIPPNRVSDDPRPSFAAQCARRAP